MKRSLLILVTAAGGLLAQSGITLPRVGFIRDDACALRPVYGMAGNFVLGQPLAKRVASSASSSRLGPAKDDRSLYAFDREDRRMGWFETAPTRDCGKSAFSSEIALEDGKRVLAVDNELILRQPDGAETRTVLSGTILGMEVMGEGWIHVREAGRHTAARLVEDRLEVYRLPGAAPR